MSWEKNVLSFFIVFKLNLTVNGNRQQLGEKNEILSEMRNVGSGHMNAFRVLVHSAALM